MTYRFIPLGYCYALDTYESDKAKARLFILSYLGLTRIPRGTQIYKGVNT